MLFLSFINRHSRFTAQADAFAGGVLHGRDLERFEAHLGACDACRSAVANARELKSAIHTLPLARAPRSFRVTSAMLDVKHDRRPAGSGTPLYLGLARATAGLAVAAFATAFVFFSMDSSDSAGDQSAGANADTDAGGAAALATSATDAPRYESAASETPVTPQMAPVSPGDASGSGVQPPTTGSEPTATDRTLDGETNSAPANADDDKIGPLSATDLVAASPSAEDDGGDSTAVAALGGVAVVALVGLAALEINRRRA